MMELWIMCEGENKNDERKIIETNNIDDLYTAIDACSEEVENSLEKYFELITDHRSYVFESMYDFDKFIVMQI